MKEYIDPRSNYRSTLGEYIDDKLRENVIPHAHDTQLHYFYEGDGSIASNLSSLESPSPANHQHSFIMTQSRTHHNDDDDDDIIL